VYEIITTGASLAETSRVMDELAHAQDDVSAHCAGMSCDVIVSSSENHLIARHYAAAAAAAAGRS